MMISFFFSSSRINLILTSYCSCFRSFSHFYSVTSEVLLLTTCAVCMTSGLIASFNNLPMLTESCIDSSMDDKTTYNTMIRIAGSWSGSGTAFLTLLLHYNWRHVVHASGGDHVGGLRAMLLQPDVYCGSPPITGGNQRKRAVLLDTNENGSVGGGFRGLHGWHPGKRRR